MGKPLATCRCDRWPGKDPCTRLATAEDFLCDECRQARNGTPDKCRFFNFTGAAGEFARAHIAVTYVGDMERLPF